MEIMPERRPSDAATPRVATSTRRTFHALLGYGLDSMRAQALLEAGYTVARLQQKRTDDLVGLDVPFEVAARLRAGGRPPVPAATVFRLLFESRGVCCVCREPRAPVVLHHLVEWSSGGGHDEVNLVVVCLNHHGEAHSQHSMSQNLDAARLREAKARWIELVRRLDHQVVFRAPMMGEGAWDYFNHPRLIRALLDAGMRLDNIPYFDEARAGGMLQGDGSLSSSPGLCRRRYIYEGVHSGSNYLYSFFNAAATKLLERRPPIPTSLDFSRTLFRDVAVDGSLVAIKGRHWFTTARRVPSRGPGQTRNAVFRRNGVEVRFVIDAWEAVSDSAYGRHLSGQWIATSVGVVRSRRRDTEHDRLVVEMTCFAVGSCWGDPTWSRCPYQFTQAAEDGEPPDDWWDEEPEPSEADDGAR